MRFLKVLTIGMGVLIVVATIVLVVVIARRIGGPGTAPAPVAVLLDEPGGTRIGLRTPLAGLNLLPGCLRRRGLIAVPFV